MGFFSQIYFDFIQSSSVENEMAWIIILWDTDTICWNVLYMRLTSESISYNMIAYPPSESEAIIGETAP